MKQIHYIIAITTAALLTACDKEGRLSGESTDGQIAVREISLTRAETNGTVSLDGGYATLTVYAYEGTTGTADNNTVFNYKDGVWQQDKTLLVPKQDANFIGVAGADTPFSFTLAKDQSTSKGMYAADLMTTDRTPLGADRSLSLNFKHRLSQVTVNITEYGTEFGSVKPEISSATFQSAASVTLNYEAPETVTVTSDPSTTAVDITPTGSQSSGYTAIIAPKAVNEQLMTLQLKNGDKPLTVKTTTAIESGKSYTFSLKVGKDYVVLENISIGEWQETIAQTGNTTNIALPEVTNAQAGIFIHYADGDADNVENAKLGAGTSGTSQMIDHVWKSKEAKPHIVIYSPYDGNIAYNGSITLEYGKDYYYASVNGDGTKTVSELLNDGNTLTVGDAYRHIMGKVTLIFKDSNGAAITPTAVKLNNFYEKGSLNLKNGTVAATGSRIKEKTIEEWNSLLIVPQSIPRFANMVSITYNSKNYIYTPMESDVVIGSGEHLTLTLTVPATGTATTSTTRAAKETPRQMQGIITLNKERR